MERSPLHVSKVFPFLLAFAVFLSLPSYSQAGGKKVAASVLPVYVSVKNVVGERARVGLLVQPGGDMHDYFMRPGDIKTLEEAEIVFINGASLEGFLAGRLRGKRVVDVSRGIKLIEAGGEADPHVWLNPLNAAVQVKNIRDEMAGYDPGGREFYEKNADEYIGMLLRLDEDIMKGLSVLRTKHLITYHAAFGYFAERYGLIPHSISGIGGGHARPDALAGIYITVKREGVPAVFVEKGYMKEFAERLRIDLGVDICELDDVTAGPSEPGLYERAMRGNLSEIIRCLGGR